MIELEPLFTEINLKHFDGFLDLPVLQWNSRLRSSAGRFIPGSRKFLRVYPPRIEIALYLNEEEKASQLIYDTMGHEMIHLWLWVRRRPYGHTPDFLFKMEEMGVSRYNSVPRTRSFKYIYQCSACLKSFPSRKRLGTLACSLCCEKHAGGRYDARFKLVLSKALKSGELALE